MSLFIAKPSSSRPLARTRTNTALALSVAFGLTASAAFAQTTAPAETQGQPAATQSTTAQPAAQPTAQAQPSAPQQTTPAQTAPTMSRVPSEAPAAPTAPAQPATPPTAAQPNAGGQVAPVQAAPVEAAPVQTVPPHAGSATEASPAAPVNPAQRTDIPHDLSPWGMFLAAHWVVKAVMIGLAAASLITWTVWLAKTLELFGARSRAGRTLKLIRKARTLSEALEAAGTRGGPAALMLRAAAEEVQLSEGALDHAENAGVKERVASTLSRIEAYAGRRMARGTGVLATIGSTAPFVGLFGTVWGIMNAFIGISESHTTNLAIVAPGIAEALLATAIGLVAAIPAVVIYNVFARSVTGYRQLLADASAGVERLVSRDLDYRKVPPGSRSKSSVSLVAGG